MMKRPGFPVILDTLQALALAVWLGNLAATFLFVRTGPTSLMQDRFARDSGALIELCGLLVVGAQFLVRRRYLRDRTQFVCDGVRQLLTFGAFFLAEYSKYVLNAHPDPMAGKLDTAAGTVIGAQIALLIGITALTSWLQQPRVAPPSSGAPPAAAPPRTVAPPRLGRKKKR